MQHSEIMDSEAKNVKPSANRTEAWRHFIPKLSYLEYKSRSKYMRLYFFISTECLAEWWIDSQRVMTTGSKWTKIRKIPKTVTVNNMLTISPHAKVLKRQELYVAIFKLWYPQHLTRQSCSFLWNIFDFSLKTKTYKTNANFVSH